jgi:hypothetical protein
MLEGSIATDGMMNLNSLFEPDILSTHQFSKVSQAGSQSEPEHRLMFAVLTDAIECFQRYRGAKRPANRRLSENAEAWINSRDSNWPYSFEPICEVLNINPCYLRLGLMQWRAIYESNPRRRLRPVLRYQHRVKRRGICV